MFIMLHINFEKRPKASPVSQGQQSEAREMTAENAFERDYFARFLSDTFPVLV